MSKNKKFKVGVIGPGGYIGMVHLEMLRRIKNVEIVSIAQPNKDKGQQIADQFDIPLVYTDPMEMIQDKETAVIHNCTPNHLHFQYNKAILEAKKELLSEKPLSFTAAESAELVSLADKNNLTTAINFCYRYYPVIQDAAVRVKKGEIGEIRALTGHFLQDWLLYESDYSWRLNPEISGSSNTLADLGSHWCDLVQFITGRKIVEVFAELNTCVPKRDKPTTSVQSFGASKNNQVVSTSISLEDYASMFIRLDNGAKGNFTTCQVAAGKKVDIDLQLFGSIKSFGWNHVHPNALWIGNRNKGNELFYESAQHQQTETQRYALLPTGHPMGYHDTMYNLFCDFYTVLQAKQNGKETGIELPDFKAGLAAMKILEAALESYKKGTWCKVK